MHKLISNIQQFFSSPSLLPPGIYPYQSPPSADQQYRLHLRVEKDGQGILILNASTVLHLNQTATEYAYHLIQQTPNDEVIKIISKRYQIKPMQVEGDFDEFEQKIHTMIEEPDVDPVHFLDIDREKPYMGALSAPYRIDLALTYQLPEEGNPDLAPTRRVDRELSTDEWSSIIDKAWKAGIPHVTFTGGEPTLRDDLIDLITYAESKGQVTGLLSDGFRLLKAQFLEDLLLSGLDHLMFVLTPGQDPSWKALQRVLAEDLHTTVHITIHPGLIGQIEGMITRLADMGANALSLSISSPQDRDLETSLQQARTHAADTGLPLKWNLPVPYSAHNPVNLELEEEETGAEKAWVYVEPDGDLLAKQGDEEVLGNLLREEWDQIWTPADQL